MPLNPELQPEELVDAVSALPQGMNAGVAPVLLEKTQLSFLTNGTVRSDFPWHRPTYRKVSLTFDSAVTQGNFQSQKFQGAGMFNPVVAGDCLLASIGGNIFKLTPGIDGEASVVNANPPGDFNPAAPNQVWIFQTERWAIINDGQSIPMISDGATTRRANTGGFLVTVKNMADPNVGSNYAAGTVVASLNGQYGILYAGNTCNHGIFGPPISYSWPAGLVVGTSVLFALTGVGAATSQVIIGGDLWNITNTTTVTIPFTSGGNQFCSPGVLNPIPGFNATNVTPIAPGTSYANGLAVYSTSQGQVVDPGGFVVPGIGSTAQVHLSQAYSSTVPGPIFINGHAYQVTAIGGVTYPAAAPAPEMPPGRMGCNAGGRTWIALPDGKSYIASDLTGDQSSGTANFQYTDAVLHFTENTLLAGGGAFRIPSPNGNITAMLATETLDASLGQGPIEIFSPTQIFSCNAPTDRTTWQSLTYPIQSVSLLGAGGMSQWSTISVNSDTLFRSIDGIRSLVLARRDFNVWGNVPYSQEMEPILASDNTALLAYSSAINFDNRAVFTTNPIQHAQGVYHDRLIALNLDPVSSLAGKAPSVYDGVWTGINVLQLVTGVFTGVQRAFAFVLNLSGQTGVIELWEILQSPPDPDFLPVAQITEWSAPANHFDNGTTPIPQSMIFPVLDFSQKDPRSRKYLQLNNGEITVDHMSGTVQFEVWYKPDDYPFWTLWLRWTEKSRETGGIPDFRPRMGLGTPSGKDCDTGTNRPLREGYNFQVKLIIIGNARFKSAKFKAITVAQPKYQPPNCATLLVPGP